MNIKSLLLGSAAALIAVSGARAADAIVVAEPEPAEYVRICDVYGAGFFYIPGTETCLKIGGYLRYDIGVGSAVGGYRNTIDKKDTLAWEMYDNASDAYEEAHAAWEAAEAEEEGSGGLEPVAPTVPGRIRTHDSYYKLARAQVNLDARSETEYGTLRGFLAVNFDRRTTAARQLIDIDAEGNPRSGLWTGTERAWDIDHAIIQLGGLTIAYTDSLFESLTDSAGAGIANDGLVSYSPGKTHLIAYTFDGGNGFSATIGVEEGAGNFALDSYVPHVVAGASFTQGWGRVAGVIGYDSVTEEIAGKLRVDVNINEALSVWAMAGYQDWSWDRAYAIAESPASPSGSLRGSYYGVWGGDWAVWAGAQYKVNEKLALNAQVSLDDAKTFGAVVGANYFIVPGLEIRPEIAYTSWRDYDVAGKRVGKKNDEWGGFLRFQRSF